MPSLWEIARALPNGFHDALLRSYRADFVARTVSLDLELAVGGPAAAEPAAHGGYAAATVVLTRLAFWEVQAPDSRYPFQNPAPLRIELVECDPSHLAVRAAGPGAFAGSFFVTNWNAFIHFAAEDASLEWRHESPATL